jgi:glycosyltransferase involved in cell wall biosynthesis
MMATTDFIEEKNGDFRVGFLTYDLQEFTADCLSRVARRSPFRIKAYPIFARIAADHVAFPYRPSTLAGRFFAVRKEGSTPEGFTSSVNWSAAWACVRENDVVVLLGLQGGTALLATFLSFLRRRRLVSVNQTLPPQWERKRRWWVRWLKGWILHRCRVHLVQTPVTWKTLQEVYGIPKEHCVEAPFESGALVFQELLNKVSESREELRQQFGWGPDEVIFLFVGTLLRFKGVETIIEAITLLKNSHSGFRVVFFGPAAAQPDEPTIEKYQGLVELKGVAEVVSFMGERSLAELARAYLAADALLLPTQKDCWPKVLVEAALAGLPLLTTTACGAAGDLVRDGETGLVISPDDPESLFKAMQQLLKKEVRVKFGENARNICLKLCDPIREAEGFCLALKMAMREVNEGV